VVLESAAVLFNGISVIAMLMPTNNATALAVITKAVGASLELLSKVFSTKTQ